MSKKSIKSIKPAHVVVGNLIYVDFQRLDTRLTQAEIELEQEIIDIFIKHRSKGQTTPELVNFAKVLSSRVSEKRRSIHG